MNDNFIIIIPLYKISHLPHYHHEISIHQCSPYRFSQHLSFRQHIYRLAHISTLLSLSPLPDFHRPHHPPRVRAPPIQTNNNQHTRVIIFTSELSIYLRSRINSYLCSEILVAERWWTSEIERIYSPWRIYALFHALLWT